MSALTIYPLNGEAAFDADGQRQYDARYADFAEIRQQLEGIGVQFERWDIQSELPDDADQDTVIAAYHDPLAQLKELYGFQSIDVIQVTPDHPDKVALREKFLAEHIHDDFEVRFFIAGYGLFNLHVEDKIYAVLCGPGDLISVPANTRHWFDMGENPDFKTIRLFTTPYGWVANFTGDPIAGGFPSLDQTVAELS